MVGEEQFTGVLEKIYAAALGESFWPEALGALGMLFGSPFAHFEVLDKRTGLPVFFRNEGATEDALARYVEYYSAVSPRVAAGKLQPEGYVSYDHDILTEAEIDRNEYYVDFMRPQGYRYFLAANLINDDRLVGVFSVQRPIGQPHASEQEIALMRRLAPHLSRAVKISLRLSSQGQSGGFADPLFEHSTTGIVFLDRNGAVVSFNEAARDIVTDPRLPMEIRAGRLALGNAGEAAALDRLIGRAIATATGAGFAPAGALTVSRPGALPLTVVAVPFPGGWPLVATAGAPVAALLLHDPARAASLPDGLLRSLFGLTPAECRVAAALVAGRSPSEYADEAGIGIRTVRTHISRSLAKTGTRNQIELVRLLGGLPYRFG